MNQNLRLLQERENLRYIKYSETLQLETLKEKHSDCRAQDSPLSWEYWFSCLLNVYHALMWYNRETFQVENSLVSCLVSIQWGGWLQTTKTARIDSKIFCSAGKNCLVVGGKPFSPASSHFGSHDTVLHSMAASQDEWERHWYVEWLPAKISFKEQASYGYLACYFKT